ncbi:MAG: UDP-3-O-(3-hydroxymyristoyl)glucosamine N-acyltransferase [Pyramidobacter sp.]|nr:UDP-3-O-(3-hydroxymyristoyl)glucosamine N-acyltransferase [Pyramidobacter sp.]
MKNSYTLNELAGIIGARVTGDGERVISGLSELHNPSPERLSFVSDAASAADLPENIAVVAEEAAFPQGHDGLVVEAFRKAMGELLTLFEPRYAQPSGIAQTAFVHPDAVVSDTASIGPQCTVSAGARIADGVRLIANVYVGPDAEIGADTVVEPMAVIQRRSVVGKRCLIHSCAVIGADGFGIIPGGPDGSNIKIPQIGRVVLGDDVEIGACTCIDRATIGDTHIARGTKMDNQVQIGHNCRLGKNCIIASQSGIAGSTVLEDGVIMGARSGATGHITIRRGTQLAGTAIVMKSTAPGSVLSGHPACNHSDDFRLKASLRRVPDMMKRLKALERKVFNEQKDS